MTTSHTTALKIMQMEPGQATADSAFAPWVIHRTQQGYSVTSPTGYACHDVADGGVALAVAYCAAYVTRVLAAQSKPPEPKSDDKEPWLCLSVNIGPK